MLFWVLTDFVSITRGLLGFLFYRTVYALFKFFRNISRIRKSESVEYENSAEIRRILWKRRFCVVDVASPTDFLTWYETTTHPNYVLKTNVSLYSVTKDEVVFVETPEEMNIYRSDIYPFLYMSQFQHCRRVITMPIASFHRMATEMGELNEPIIWLSNTGRCGSTILGQIFESVTSTILISENDSLTNLALLKSGISQKDYDNLFVSIVRIICKPRPGIKRFCIKTRSCGIVHLEAISRLFPQIKHIFLYRNALETISSFIDYSNFDLAKILIRFCTDSNVVSWLFPFFRNRLYYYSAFETQKLDKSPADLNLIEMLAAMWASFISEAKTMNAYDNKILFIKYETLISSSQRTCRTIFESVGIDVSEMETAMCVMKKHSQKGTEFDHGLQAKSPWRHINQSNRKLVNDILSKHDLPLLGEDVYI